MGERDPLANQFVDAWRVDVGIAKRTNRVVALLVIGSPFGGLDPRVCAQLEETAVLLSGSLEAQLG